MVKKVSPTHARRLHVRSVNFKAWPDDAQRLRAFSNTEGDQGDGNRGTYYEAVTRPAGGNAIYKCTRVFTRETLLPIVIGGGALEAARTMVWLGTNTCP